MSTTLSRRIRRIGLLPTTFKTSTETRLVKDKETGKEIEKEFSRKIPIRHNEKLTTEQRAAREWDIRLGHQKANREFRTKRKAARAAARAKSLASRKAPKSVIASVGVKQKKAA